MDVYLPWCPHRIRSRHLPSATYLCSSPSFPCIKHIPAVLSFGLCHKCPVSLCASSGLPLFSRLDSKLICSCEHYLQWVVAVFWTPVKCISCAVRLQRACWISFFNRTALPLQGNKPSVRYRLTSLCPLWTPAALIADNVVIIYLSFQTQYPDSIFYPVDGWKADCLDLYMNISKMAM